MIYYHYHYYCNKSLFSLLVSLEESQRSTSGSAAEHFRDYYSLNWMSQGGTFSIWRSRRCIISWTICNGSIYSSMFGKCSCSNCSIIYCNYCFSIYYFCMCVSVYGWRSKVRVPFKKPSPTGRHLWCLKHTRKEQQRILFWIRFFNWLVFKKHHFASGWAVIGLLYCCNFIPVASSNASQTEHHWAKLHTKIYGCRRLKLRWERWLDLFF